MDSFDLDGHIFISRKLASTALGMHPNTLTNWRCSGREPIRSYKFGHGVYYRRADVDDYLARNSSRHG